MERHGSDTRVPSTTASRYFEKLTKALPGSKAWSGIRARDFWPEGAKLVISVSLQFTAGAEPWENSSSSDFAPRQSVPRRSQAGWRACPRELRERSSRLAGS